MYKIWEVIQGVFIVLFGFLATIIVCGIFGSCCSYNAQDHEEIDKLKLEISQQDQIIRAYESFRNIAIDVYINQVDSTGDGFDESDKGVDFWNKSADIDSLLRKKGGVYENN